MNQEEAEKKWKTQFKVSCKSNYQENFLQQNQVQQDQVQQDSLQQSQIQQNQQNSLQQDQQNSLQQNQPSQQTPNCSDQQVPPDTLYSPVLDNDIKDKTYPQKPKKPKRKRCSDSEEESDDENETLLVSSWIEKIQIINIPKQKLTTLPIFTCTMEQLQNNFIEGFSNIQILKDLEKAYRNMLAMNICTFALYNDIVRIERKGKKSQVLHIFWNKTNPLFLQLIDLKKKFFGSSQNDLDSTLKIIRSGLVLLFINTYIALEAQVNPLFPYLMHKSISNLNEQAIFVLNEQSMIFSVFQIEINQQKIQKIINTLKFDFSIFTIDPDINFHLQEHFKSHGISASFIHEVMLITPHSNHYPSLFLAEEIKRNDEIRANTLLQVENEMKQIFQRKTKVTNIAFQKLQEMKNKNEEHQVFQYINNEEVQQNLLIPKVSCETIESEDEECMLLFLFNFFQNSLNFNNKFIG